MQKSPKARNDLESRVGLLEYQFNEIFKKLDRMEAKQDASIRQIDTLQYVSTHEFDQYTKEASQTYATKTDLSGQSKLLYWLLGLVGSIFLLGVAAFIGIVIK